VKAVVNAYTGSVTLYAWDASDPVLRTWMKAFPGVIKPKSEIPAALMPHLRYPPDLFEVQRQILTQYHVLSAQPFYGGQNFWAVPEDPSNSGATNPTSPTNPGGSGGSQPASQPPYYQTMKMPGGTAQFSLTSPLVQRGRQNMAAYMAVDSNPALPGYGTIRVLQLPQDIAILGPQQVQSTFESNTTISSQLSLYRQNGSKVIEGNLITLPVGGALIYVEPIYIQAANTTGGSTSGSYPVLRRVAVSFNGNVGFSATLSGALSQVIPGLGAGSGGSSGSSGSGGAGSGQGSASAVVRGFLTQAETDYNKAQAALKTGDFASYGKYTALMKQALDQAQKAAQSHSSSSAKATPSPSASP
jgi:uncharacterized membrane protein (UPF0182 family)